MDFTQKQKVEMFDFLLYFEQNIRNNKNRYSLSNNSLQDFIKRNKIMIKRLTQDNKGKIKNNPFILCCWGNDRAYDLLRHIRNSIAHGNAKIKSTKRVEIHDYDRNGNETLYGKIRFDLLMSLIKEIIKTSK
ncbi:MAG: hypothetical protein IJS73_03810 [Paludibacteraceae bacterium]|nr:hypothetical protein [Paludibacteraceae bacterium]